MPKLDNHDRTARTILELIDKAVEGQRGKPVKGELIQGWVPPDSIPPSVIPDLSPLEADITALQGDVTTLQSDVGDLQTAVTAVEGDVTTLQSDVSTLQTDVTTLEGTVSGQASTLSNHESRITANESSITTHTSQIGTNTSNIATNTSNIASNTSTISSHTSTLSTHTSQIAANTSAISANATAIDAKPDNFDELPDTPSSKLSSAGFTLVVGSGGSSINYVAPKTLEVAETTEFTGIIGPYLYPSWAYNPARKPNTPNANDQEFQSTSSFTWLNQGTASVSYGSHEAVMTDTSASSANPIVRGLYKSVGSTFTLKAQLGFQPAAIINAIGGGLLLYESSTGKVLMFGYKLDASTDLYLSLDYAATTTSAWTTSTSTKIFHQQVYLQLARSGSTLTASYSLNGRNYTTVGTLTVTTPFTTAPNNGGLYIQTVSGTTGKAVTLVSDWVRYT